MPVQISFHPLLFSFRIVLGWLPLVGVVHCTLFLVCGLVVLVQNAATKTDSYSRKRMYVGKKVTQ